MGYREEYFKHDKGFMGRYRCVSCGGWFTKDEIEIDHKISKRYGGTDNYSNLQAMCRHCNRSKRERSTGRDIASSCISAAVHGDLGELVGGVAKQKVKDAFGIKYKRK